MEKLKKELSKFGKVEICKRFEETGIEIKITEGFKNEWSKMNEINSILLRNDPLLSIDTFIVEDGIFHLKGTTV